MLVQAHLKFALAYKFKRALMTKLVSLRNKASL